MMLKKIILLSLFILVISIFTACNFQPNNESDYTEKFNRNTTENKIVNITESDTTVPLDTTAKDMTVAVDRDSGGIDEDEKGVFSSYKYRCVYYSISYPFVQLVGEDRYYDWWYSEYDVIPQNERNEMAMVAFVKAFNISREQFDKANAKHIQTDLESGRDIIENPSEYEPGYDRAKEVFEVYNADIIYTFDNEIINSYYLYVDPYEEISSEQYQ